jgi:hypothetical protein
MPEYNEGPEAKERFEETMKSLFQAPRSKKSKVQPDDQAATLRKPAKSDKD